MRTTYVASDSLENRYIKRKVSEANYSILIALLIFTVVGLGFYLKLDSLPLLIGNLMVIAVPTGIYVYMSIFKRGKNVNTIISKIDITNTEYRFLSYSFKSLLFVLPPAELVFKLDSFTMQKVNFPYNEDGLESDKKDTLCITNDGRTYYLLYKYFPSLLLDDLQRNNQSL